MSTPREPSSERGAGRPAVAWIALGSNLGDRDAALRFAVRALDDEPGMTVRECSPVYETEPVGPGEQGPYLNAVLSLETTLAAPDLLAVLQRVEAAAGRRRERESERWGPRALDLDLLFYAGGGGSTDHGGERIDAPGLTVPHPRIAERGFVLVPLADLAPALVHPVTGRRVDEMLAALGREARDAVRPWERCRRLLP